jgi:hypothetical protein
MKSSHHFRYVATITATFLPFITFASTDTLKDLVAKIVTYFDLALAFMMGLAVVLFVFYVIRYFIASAEGKRTEGALYIMWSVIGFFVIFSLWGLVNILISTFDLGHNQPGSWSNLQTLFPH